ncbi:MAG TPA: ATP-binding protein [Steroidobacteraceae bacterium]|nr:ATP-binding protein [Steroidobacteraceae bacterium]
MQSSPTDARRDLTVMLSSSLVRSVLDSLPDAIVIIDSTGNVLFANHQVEALFGFSSSEIVGGPVEVLLPERFRHRHVAHRKGYTGNVRVRPMGAGLDLFATRKDGTEFPVEISLSPVTFGDDILVAAAIRDVTDRKQVEQALKEARREADHANLAKSRFLATASHDLRQPLQTLGLLNGALRRMVTDGECREVIDQQELAVDAMSRLINALLDISKLESGAIKLELTAFEIGTLFEELRGEFAGLANSKGLRFSTDSPGELVYSDPALVGQVLRNLVSNAIKYTHAGSVELRCEHRGPQLRIEIRDTGVGIAAEQLPHIFEEFYQVGVSPNSSREGYGLGLSIVQRIARLLDMKVEVNSVLRAGSVFSVELPVAQNADRLPAASESKSAPDAVAGGTFNLLLVEDEPSVLNAMRILLTIEGYRVVTAPTAAEALELLRDGVDFDLIITDYHLEAGRTGTQVISVAREMLGDSLKAILVTGDTSSAVRELQGDDNLRITSKPINSSELLGLVKTLLAG